MGLKKFRDKILKACNLNVSVIVSDIASRTEEVCPHCGYYCTNNSVYCLPPLKSIGDADGFEM